MLDSEASVIGSILINGDSINDIALCPEDFSIVDFQDTYRILQRMAHDEVSIDIVTVSEEVKKAGLVNIDLVDLANLARNTPSAKNIKAYANNVKQSSMKRSLANVLSGLLAMVENDDRSAPEMLEAAQEAVMCIDERSASREPVKISTLMLECVNEIEKVHNGDDDTASTGLIDLDAKVTIKPTDLVVVAGRPAMGKSAFSVQIGRAIANHSKKPCLAFQLEMSGGQMVQRILASESKVSLSRLRKADLEPHHWDDLVRTVKRVREENFWIDDSSYTLQAILSSARRFKRRYGLGCIVVDYLQLISADASTREQEVSKISRSFKMAAKALNVPVILLSQLSRKCEERQDKRPMMSDLRESGAIEQDADTILMLYRDEVYNENTDYKGVCEVLVRKQRSGETGMVPIVFDGPTVSFKNHAGNYDPNPAKGRDYDL